MPRFLTWSDEAPLMEALARNAGVEEGRVVERVALYGGDLETKLRTAGTAVLEFGDGKFVGLLGDGRVLMPDLSIIRVRSEEIVDAILESTTTAMPMEIEELLNPRARRACSARACTASASDGCANSRSTRERASCASSVKRDWFAP